MRRLPRSAAMAAALLAWAAAAAAAQLRPLEPMDWGALGEDGHTVVVGAGMFGGQRASLAGTEGLLLELGAFRATWSLGRVALELAGTALRFFEERSSFADPVRGVVAADGTRRTDTGDYRVSTLVELTTPNPARELALRFGVRLPTTDNLKGLDRDQTDFYSLVAGRLARGPVEVAGEVGIGINGTRDLEYEQVDPLLFVVSARYGLGALTAVLEAAGQHDTRAGRERRGTEDLGEARLGVQLGRGRWVSVAAVRGWTPYSPDLGLIVSIGTRF